MASMRALTRSNSALVAISGTITSRHHRLAGALCRFDRGLEDGARLHLGDFRIGDRDAAAAEAEHRVELRQIPGAVGDFPGSTPIACATSAISLSPCGRNSCSGGSSRRIVTGRPLMISNSSTKSARCIGNSLATAARRDFSSSARIISRTAWMRSSSKNICSVRHSPMPSAPNLTATRASAGVSALARTPSLRTLSAQPISVANSPDSCGSIIATLPASTWPVEPSTVMKSPCLKVCPPAVMVRLGIVDPHRAGAGNAGLAHAARHHRRVRGHAAARGENAFGGVHAVDVFRRGFDPHQNDFWPSALSCVGLVGGEHDLARRRAGRGRQAGGDHLALGVGIDGRMQQLIERQPDRRAAPPRSWRSGLHWRVRPRCAAPPWRCACRSGSAASTACPARR